MISEKREIVISNFCFKTKFPEIRKFLNSFNPIPKKIRMLRNNGSFNGIVFVRYLNYEEAKIIIEKIRNFQINGTEFETLVFSELEVNFSITKPNSNKKREKDAVYKEFQIHNIIDHLNLDLDDSIQKSSFMNNIQWRNNFEINKKNYFPLYSSQPNSIW